METRTSLNPRQPALANDVRALRDAILGKLTYALGSNPETAAKQDWYTATALAVRDRVIDIWMRRRGTPTQQRKKRVYYLSIEFLVGKAAARHADQSRPASAGARGAGFARRRSRQLREAANPIPALGNGGLGRLAACYHRQHGGAGDSRLRLRHPLRVRPVQAAIPRRLAGGIARRVAGARQSVGVRAPGDDLSGPFRRRGRICRRRQRDRARRSGIRPKRAGGRLRYAGRRLARPPRQHAAAVVRARATQPSSACEPVRRRRHVGATAPRIAGRSDLARALSERRHARGQELRLRQEYFFTSASLQDLVRRHLSEHDTLDRCRSYAAIQLNDTHPAIAVAELMRILVDEHDFSWSDAWRITRRR